MNQQINNINSSIEKITKKDFGIYFFTLDTKGNPTAGVATIYEHVKILRELGFNAQILHDKNDYKLREDENGIGIAEWLGEEYATLPHISIESQTLQVGPADFVIIPEAFASIMKETASNIFNVSLLTFPIKDSSLISSISARVFLSFNSLRAEFITFTQSLYISCINSCRLSLSKFILVFLGLPIIFTYKYQLFDIFIMNLDQF